MRHRSLSFLALVSVLAIVANACSSNTPSTSTSTTGGATAASFDLKIGDLVSLSGDLASYGPAIDKGAQVAVAQINDALRSAGMSDKITVEIAATEDDQTDAKASVEAATKLVQTDKVNMIMGPLASTDTEAVAQSVAIPNQIVEITPSSTDPAITSLQDNGYVWRTAPSDLAQAHLLAKTMADAFGADATINVGARNDAYGTGLTAAFEDSWKAGGGTIGESVTWNPDAATFDTEAQQLTGGAPDGWLIIDFPETFAKVGPALVRTGSWDPTKTFVTDGLRDAKLPDSAGTEATEGLRGTSPTSAPTDPSTAFDSVYAAAAPTKVDRGTFDVNAFDAVMVTFLAALKAGSSDPADIIANLEAVSGPPGTKYTFQDLDQAIADVTAGKDIDYEGASGPIDFTPEGDPAGLYDVWGFTNGKIVVTQQAISQS
jgi:ABC-type branched-subunit amino acid transport system substrate-binding protein